MVLFIHVANPWAVWYYFNDIYPPTHGNHRPLDPPRWWIRMWEGEPEEEIVEEEEDPTNDQARREFGVPPINL